MLKKKKKIVAANNNVFTYKITKYKLNVYSRRSFYLVLKNTVQTCHLKEGEILVRDTVRTYN